MEVYNAMQVAAYSSGIGIETMIGAAVASVLICTELPRRFGGATAADITPRTIAKGCAHVAIRCLPEVSGLALVTGAGLLLRMFGPAQKIATPMDQQIWDSIIRDWPILHGGDTLLGFQAMLRLLVLLVITVRLKRKSSVPPGETDAPSTPLSGMAGVFALAAMITRVSMCSRNDSYWLDGPLGQGVGIAWETAMVPLLTALAFGTVTKAPLTAAAAVSTATMWASRHYLNLAQDSSIDRLFTLAHTLEILAASAFLYSTIRSFFGPRARRNMTAATGFVYILMPLQQGLAAYYFLTALNPGPETVGSGRPWCLLILGNLLQLGLYLCAAAMWLASYLVNGSSEGTSASASDSVRMPINSQEHLAVATCPEKATQCATQPVDTDEATSQIASAVFL